MEIIQDDTLNEHQLLWLAALESGKFRQRDYARFCDSKIRDESTRREGWMAHRGDDGEYRWSVLGVAASVCGMKPSAMRRRWPNTKPFAHMQRKLMLWSPTGTPFLVGGGLHRYLGTIEIGRTFPECAAVIRAEPWNWLVNFRRPDGYPMVDEERWNLCWSMQS